MFGVPRLSLSVARLAREGFDRRAVVGCVGNFSTKFTAASADEVKKLAESDRVVLFMKGDRQQPMCGFSNLAVKVN